MMASSPRIITFSFLFVILLGAFLLTLPISTKDGIVTPFIDSLFTATSATCITGLAVYDTFSYWSFFGQAVILALIQIGGLGVMSFVAIFSFVIGRKISLKERRIMAESFSIDTNQGIIRMVRQLLRITFLCELIGACLLAIRFVPQFGWSDGIWFSVFHSVSAFCNAGFDLMGKLENGISLTAYVGDPLVNIVIMALIVIGGLGFFVWRDLLSFKQFRKLRVHTKIVLFVTAGLILFGAIAFWILEKDNSFRDFDTGERILASFFQSITPRTAGFCTVDSALLSDPSKFVTVLLMFIGGSPGSMAGGVKTVTFALAVFAAFSVARGVNTVNFAKRKINWAAVMRAIAIILISMLFVMIALVLLSATQPFSFLDLLFEAVSAFGTVGMSTGVTAGLTAFGKSVIMILMFFGRVGVLSIAIAFTVRAKTINIEYPEEKVIVG